LTRGARAAEIAFEDKVLPERKVSCRVVKALSPGEGREREG
jgi:hypothetical protein